MAFASAITKQGKMPGTGRVVFGTFENTGGGTGGDIKTGLLICEFLFMQPYGSSVIAAAATVNETFPVSGGEITVVNTADEDGIWWAIGS